jgi:DnaK suppressor protein
MRLRQILESHRVRLLGEIAERLRHAREETQALHTSDVLDRVERVQEEDIEYALLGMKTETIQRIDEALGHLDAGEYGLCSECGQEISDGRLSALPFAIRCRECEESAEMSAPWRSPRRSPVLFDEANV